MLYKKIMDGETMIVKISVNTVTPIYTGDAFGINAIKPQSIIGSLRFWFEIFLKAVNQLHSGYNYKDENLNLKKYNDDVLNTEGIRKVTGNFDSNTVTSKYRK